jgi:AraC-like DNA-binding protein
VSDENFLLLNEGTTYSSYIEPGNDVESLTINFDREYQSEVRRVMGMPADKLLDQPFEAPGELVFVEEKLYKHNSFVSPHIFKIRLLSMHFYENRAAINETLYFLLGALIHNNATLIHEIRNVPAARLSTKKEIYRRLHEVKDYIDSCSNEDITLESLSRIALMSPFHLLRQFRKNFHNTPHQYLINCRMNRALNILRTSDATLADICFLTGFRDTSSFSKLFRKRYRLSPQQYRESVKKV